MKRLAIAAVIVAGSVISFGSASAKTYHWTLCAASVGGTWSLVGSGIDAAVRKTFPGSQVTIQTSAGGIGNAKGITEKTCDFGIMHAAELTAALNNKEPFTSPYPNLRLIARTENWSPMHFFLTKSIADKYGIKTIEDIAKNKPPIRIVIQKRGNIAGLVAESMLVNSGVKLDDIKAWGGKVLYGASGEQTNLMQDRRADAAMNVLFPGHSSVLEMANSVPVTLISASPEVAEKVSKEWNVDKFTIEKGVYNFIPGDITTVTLGAHLVASTETPDDAVDAMLTAMVDSLDAIKEMHPSFKRMTPELFASARGLPYHEAAKRFYERRKISVPVN
jgi:TRAP transporter TAXI family solute receptor